MANYQLYCLSVALVYITGFVLFAAGTSHILISPKRIKLGSILTLIGGLSMFTGLFILKG